MRQIPGRERLLESLRQRSAPIDFEQLEKDGIVRKEGAWFRIMDLEHLPKYVSIQAKSAKTDGKGGPLFQFPKSNKWAQKLYKRLTGKEYNE